MESIGGKIMHRRPKKPELNPRLVITALLKSVIAGYVFTFIFILIFSYIVYKFDFSASQVNIGTIVITILATFISGLFAAKIMRKNGWMYGLITGVIYFIILIVVSLIINDNSTISQEAITLFFMCIGGSTLGGMIG